MAARWLAVRQTLSREAQRAGLTMFERVLLFDLASGAQVGHVPGLYVYSLALAAEDLGVTVRGAEKGMARLVELGFVRYDREARVVWREAGAVDFLGQLRTPMQIRSWSKPWQAIPECAAKRTAAEWLFAMARDKGPTFADEFANVLGRKTGSDSGSDSESDLDSNLGSDSGSALTTTKTTTKTMTTTTTKAAAGSAAAEYQAPGRAGLPRELHDRLVRVHPTLPKKVRDRWGSRAHLAEAVERALEALEDMGDAVQSPVGIVLHELDNLADDPNALAEFVTARAERLAEEQRKAERDERLLAEREAAEAAKAVRKAAEAAAEQAAWDDAFTRLHLPHELTLEMFKIRAKATPPGGRGGMNPTAAFLESTYRKHTGRDLAESVAEAAICGKRAASSEIIASAKCSDEAAQ